MKQKKSFLVSVVWLAALVSWSVSSLWGQETVLYSEGFETSNGDYTTANLTGDAKWQWGKPSIVGPSAAHSGTNCWGTLLNGTLSGPLEGFLISPAITLPALATNQVARVSFYAYVNIPDMQNKGEFLVSSNGSTWQSLVSFYEQSGGGWQRYECDVSPYAGGTIYLKFRLYLVTGYSGVVGMYVDDVAITSYTKSGSTKLLTLEANEDLGSSCPWLFTWDGTNFVQDNDIYSVARFQGGKYRDYYRVQQPLVSQGGLYKMLVREIDAEESWTDYADLIAVDHDADTQAAPDDKGNIYVYPSSGLTAPASAVTGTGSNVLSQISSRDGDGFSAYSQDYIDLDFGAADVSQRAVLVLGVTGFKDGTGTSRPFIGPPAVVVQMADTNGVYQEVGRLKPRFQYSECAFDLKPYLAGTNGAGVRVRLSSISHDLKYHLIDYVGLSTGAEPAKQVAHLTLNSATYAGHDVSAQLAAADNDAVYLTTGNQFDLAYADPGQTLAKRDFIFVSEGYYIPHGSTYFIYTWNGTSWVMRDSYGFPTTDATRTFDLTLFLPDTDGEYKVRIWQNQKESMAAIDYVSLSVNGVGGTLSSATYVPTSTDISSMVSASDNNYYNFSYAANRDRWTAYKWTGFAVNHPPAASAVSFNGSTISWSYSDADSDAQSSAQVQIWTGAGGSGSCVWNPDLVNGTQTSLAYTGSALTAGQTYYARVKVYDGSSWGVWVDAGAYTVATTMSSTTAVTSSTNFIYRGSSMPLSVTVSGAGSTPTGTIAFSRGTNSLGMAALNGSGTATFTLTNPPAGAYSIMATYSGDGSYNSSSNSISLTVSKLEGSVTLSGLAAAYDSLAKGAGVSTTPNGLSVDVTYAGSSVVPTNAGNYAVVATINDADYSGSTNGTLVISPAVLTVSASTNQSRVYGSTNPVFSLSYAGFAGADGTGRLTTLPVGFCAAGTNSNAGYYPVTVSGGVASNYTFGYVSGRMLVSKAPLVITGDSTNRPYGQVNPAFSSTLSGVVNNDNITSGYICDAVPTSPIGDYRITLKINDPGFKQGNYNVTYHSGILTVTPAVLIGQVTSQTRAYGAANAPFEVVYNPFANGEGTNVLLGDLAYSCVDSNAVAVATNTAVGSYAIQVVGGGQSCSNYSVSYLDGRLTVTQAVISVVAHDESRLYGAANPDWSATVQGFVNGESSNVFSGTLSYACGATTNSAVGTYPIVPSGWSATNYLVVYTNGTLTVGAASLTVSAGSGSRAYGLTNPILSCSISGAVAGDTLTVSSYTEASISSPVHSYPVIPVITDPGERLGNYTVTTNAGNLEVTAAPLTVRADSLSRTYGQANPVLTFSCSGFMNSEGTNLLTGAPVLTTEATNTSPVAGYPITVSVDTMSAANYSLQPVAGTLTVTQAVLGVTAVNESRFYGQTNPVFAVAYSGFANEEATNTLSGSPLITCTADTSSQPGTYPIELAQGSLSALNYTFSFTNGLLTVSKGILEVRAVDVVRAYGDANPALGVTYNGFFGGDTTNVLTGAPSLSTTATNGSPTGSFPIVVTAGTLNATNYLLNYTNGMLTVTQRVLTISPASQSRGYGQTNQALVGTNSGLVPEDAIVVNFTTEADTNSSVGGYAIEPVYSGAIDLLTNYLAQTNPAFVTVTQAFVTVRADDKTRVYGHANPPLTVHYTGFTNGQNESVLTSAPTIQTQNALDAWPGTYDITVSGGSAVNYQFAYENGTLMVQQATLTVVGEDASRAYGYANPTFVVHADGLLADDGITLETSTLADAASVPGTYDIDINPDDPNYRLGAYDVTILSGKLKITNAPLQGQVVDMERGYGQNNPSFRVAYTGFVNGQASNVLSGLLDYSCQDLQGQNVGAGSPVGNYAINVTQVQTAPYYIVSYLAGNLSVTQAVLNVRADDKNRTYGSTNPVLTVSYSGFTNGEGSNVLTAPFVASTAATSATTPAGDYPITLTGGTNSNYRIVPVSGTLTVDPKGLAVSAEPKNRAYGQANPPLTLSYSGFVNNETSNVLDSAVSVTTLATPASPIGNYAISVAGGSGHNYTISRTNGVLTIDPAALTVTASNVFRPYGQANPTLAGNIEGLVNSDPISATYDAPATAQSVGGVYVITPTLVDATGVKTNYTVSLVNGTLTVTAALDVHDGSGYYVVGDEPTLVDTNASVQDGGSLNFGGGTLTVSVVTNASEVDALSIEGVGSQTGEIDFDGSTVTYGGATVGSVSGGEGTNALVIALGTNANSAAVQALLRQVSFETPETNTAQRNFEVALSYPTNVTVQGAFALALDRPPEAYDDVVQVAAGETVRIATSQVLTNDLDLDGDTLTVEDTSWPTTRGGRVTCTNAVFTYRPPAGKTVEDSFAYVVSDGKGGEAFAMVTVQALAKKQLSVDISQVESQGVKIQMAATPGRVYLIQSSTNLVNWSALGTVTATPEGLVEILDVNARNVPSCFYRALAQ